MQDKIESATMAVDSLKLRKLVFSIRRNNTCCICLDLLTDPVITKCNHLFCKGCSNELIKESTQFSCPLCKTKLTKRFNENESGDQFMKTFSQAVHHIVKVAEEIPQLQSPRRSNLPTGSTPASKRCYVTTPKTSAGKRSRASEESYIQSSKKPSLENAITIYTEQAKETSATVSSPIANTNISCGFPSTRGNSINKKCSLQIPKLSEDGKVTKPPRKKLRLGKCKVIIETCPINEQEVAKSDTNWERESLTIIPEDVAEDHLVSVSQRSPQEYKSSRNVASRLFNVVTGQAQSPRTKVFSWLEKSVVSEQDATMPANISPKHVGFKPTLPDIAEYNAVEEKGDPYEFISSQKSQPQSRQRNRKMMVKSRRLFPARKKKQMSHNDVSIQKLTKKYMKKSLEYGTVQQVCSQVFSTLKTYKPKSKKSHQCKNERFAISSYNLETDVTAKLLVVNDDDVEERVNVSKDENEDPVDDYALFLTPKCPNVMDKNQFGDSKSQTPAKKKLLKRRKSDFCDLEDLMVDIQDAEKFSLNVSHKYNKPSACQTGKSEEKIGDGLLSNVESRRKLSGDTIPTTRGQGIAKKKKKDSVEEKRSFGYFAAGDEIVDIVVSQSDDDLPKGKTCKGIVASKNRSVDTAKEWERIAQLNRDFYPTRRRKCCNKNKADPHNAIESNSENKIKEQSASEKDLPKKAPKQSAESSAMATKPNKNFADTDQQNITHTSKDMDIKDAEKCFNKQSMMTPPTVMDIADCLSTTDKQPEAEAVSDGERSMHCAYPFKCPFIIRGKLDKTECLETALCIKCQSPLVPACEETREIRSTCEPNDRDSETDDESHDVLMTRRSIKMKILSSPLSHVIPKEKKHIKSSTGGDFNEEQPQLETEREKCVDHLAPEVNSDLQQGIREDEFQFASWNSWHNDDLTGSAERPQTSVGKDKHVEMLIDGEDIIVVPQTPPRENATSTSPAKQPGIVLIPKCDKVQKDTWYRHSREKLNDSEWSDYIQKKYCSASSMGVCQEINDGKEAMEMWKAPHVIDLNVDDECSQSGESLFGSHVGSDTYSQKLASTKKALHKDLVLAGLSGQSPQVPSSNPADEQNNEKAAQDLNLPSKRTISTDLITEACQKDYACGLDVCDDGSPIFLENASEDELNDGSDCCNTQERVKLQSHVKSLEDEIRSLKEKLKAKK